MGFRLFKHFRKQDALSMEHRWLLTGACISGAALGSKITVWGDNFAFYLAHWNNLEVLLPGKGIAGAMVGGLFSVELTKKILGIKEATGDFYVYPLITGLIIGRIGCFLVGLADNTYGIATNLPWGINFGDGVSRHPTQLYEILFLLLLSIFIYDRKKSPFTQGDSFKWFMLGYFVFRFFAEFIKPIAHPYWGLDSVQLLAILMLGYYRKSLVSIFKFNADSAES